MATRQAAAMNRVLFCGGRWALGVIALSGCAADAPNAAALFSDSAGVTLVESVEPLWGPGPRWRVESLPLVDLSTSGTGPEYEFYRVRDATRLPDGGLVVVNEGSAELRFYSASGVFEGALGGKGDGPGEFQRPISVRPYRGDSLVVFDYWARRFTVVDRSRRVARLGTLTTPFANELHPLSDGRFVLGVHSLLVRDTSVGRVRVPQPLILTSGEGAEGDTIVVVPGIEEFVFEEGSGVPPLARPGSVVVANDRVVVSDGEGVVLRTYTLGGVLERLFRIRDYPLGAPGTVRDSIRDALLGSQGPDFIRAAAREMAQDVPELFPGVMDILVDSQGNLWAAEYFPRQVTGQPRSWLVFDSRGVWLGKVLLPPDFDAYEIGSDYVLGRKRDSLDVETVQVLRLVRR